MDSKDLKPEQAQKIHDRVGPTLGYLTRLRARMDKTGFTPYDKLYQVVSKAQDALQALHTETHYLSCSGGVGRPPRE